MKTFLLKNEWLNSNHLQNCKVTEMIAVDSLSSVLTLNKTYSELDNYKWSTELIEATQIPAAPVFVHNFLRQVIQD